MKKASYATLLGAGLLCSGGVQAGIKDDAALLDALSKASLEVDFKKDLNVLMSLMNERYASDKDFLALQNAKYNYAKGSSSKAREAFRAISESSKYYNDAVSSYVLFAETFRDGEGMYEAFELYFKNVAIVQDKESEEFAEAARRWKIWRQLSVDQKKPQATIAGIDKVQEKWGFAKGSEIMYQEISAFVDLQEAVVLEEQFVKGQKVDQGRIKGYMKYIEDAEWKEQDIYFFYLVSEYAKMLSILNKPNDALAYLKRWERKLGEIEETLKSRDAKEYHEYSPVANMRYARGVVELHKAFRFQKKKNNSAVKKALIGTKKEWGAIYHFAAMRKKYAGNESALRALIRYSQCLSYMKSWLDITPKKSPTINYLTVARAEDLRGNADAAIDAYNKCLKGGAKITKSQSAEAAFRLIRLYGKKDDMATAEKIFSEMETKFADVREPEFYLGSAIQVMSYNFNRLSKKAKTSGKKTEEKEYHAKVLSYQAKLSNYGASGADAALAKLMYANLTGIVQTADEGKKAEMYNFMLETFAKFQSNYKTSQYYASAVYQMAEAQRVTKRKSEAIVNYRLFLTEKEGATMDDKIKRAKAMRVIAKLLIDVNQLDSVSGSIKQLNTYLKGLKPVSPKQKESVAELKANSDLYAVLVSEKRFNNLYALLKDGKASKAELDAASAKVIAEFDVWLSRNKKSKAIPSVIAKQALVYEKTGGRGKDMAARLYQKLYTEYKDDPTTKAVMINLIDDKMKEGRVAEAVKIGRELVPAIGNKDASPTSTLRQLLSYYLLPAVPNKKVMTTADFKHCSEFASEIARELYNRYKDSTQTRRHYYTFRLGKALVFAGKTDEGQKYLSQITKESPKSAYIFDINLLKAEALRSTDRVAAVKELKKSIGILQRMKSPSPEKLLQHHVMIAEIYHDSDKRLEVQQALQSAYFAKTMIIDKPTRDTILLMGKAEAYWIINVYRLGFDKNPAYSSQVKVAQKSFTNNPEYVLSPYMKDVKNPPNQQFD